MNIVPELGVLSVLESVRFYTDLFEAKLLESVPDDNGGFIWAEIDVYGSSLMFEEVNTLLSEFIGIDASSFSSLKGCIVFRVSGKEMVKNIYEKVCLRKVRIAMEWKETDYGTTEFGIYDLDENIILLSSKD